MFRPSATRSGRSHVCVTSLWGGRGGASCQASMALSRWQAALFGVMAFSISPLLRKRRDRKKKNRPAVSSLHHVSAVLQTKTITVKVFLLREKTSRWVVLCKLCSANCLWSWPSNGESLHSFFSHLCEVVLNLPATSVNWSLQKSQHLLLPSLKDQPEGSGRLRQPFMEFVFDGILHW